MMRNLTFVVLAVLCMVFAGCGDKADDGKGDGTPGLPGGPDGGGGGGGGGSSVGNAVGEYVLDTEKVIPMFEKMIMDEMKDDLAEMPEEQREMAVNMAKSQIKPMLSSMNFTVDLKADGTFTVKGTGMGKPVDVVGTWKQEGDKVWFTTTMENGVEKTGEETQPGRFEDGNIYFKPDAEMPFELVFKGK